MAGPPLEHVDVYTSGDDGYKIYRIPAIEAAPDGSLLAFAEARKYGGSDPGMGKQDIDLVLERSTDNGRTWSTMKIIEDPGELWSAANPATVVDRQNGRVWLLYLRSKPGRSTDTSRPGTDDMQTFARWSDDNGATWSEPLDLSKAFVDRPIFAAVLSLFILIAGLLAIPNLPISEYPEVVPPSIEVSASYPGANPQPDRQEGL